MILAALVLQGFLLATVVIQNRDHTEPTALVAIGLARAFLVTRLLCTRLPQGDEVCVVLMVGLSALGLAEIEIAVAAALGAGLVDAVARYTRATRDDAVRRVLDAVRSAAVLAMLSPWQLVLQPRLEARAVDDLVLVLVLFAGVSYMILDVLTIAMMGGPEHGTSAIARARSLLRPLSAVYLVHIAMAGVVLRVFPVLGAWAFAIALLLTLILQNSSNLYLRIRRAYAETIGALARAAELDRPQDTGHAQRVADLAVAVGRDLGLTGHELEQLGYAALLHDIGRIGYGRDDTGHARRGADIVASIPFLADVAPLIEEHHEGATEVPLGAAIVGVCSDYDRLRLQGGAQSAVGIMRSRETGERLRVLESLSRVTAQSWGPAGLSQ
jgi:putative nucleotidyltransferase with HDIG domain